MISEVLLNIHAELGEGPAWNARQQRLYWVDIHAGDLHIFNPFDGSDLKINLGESLGCVAPCKSSELILGLKSGFATINLQTNKLSRLINPEPHLPGNRFNDGKCDPMGRFLAGTMDENEKDASGSLYSLTSEGKLKKLISNLRISNGLTWSPDYHTLYYIDTPTRLVMAYDYDFATGEISQPRPIVQIPTEMGWPDGMTSDAEGMLWVALWGGAKITRWQPITGKMLAEYPIPALNVTSCVFGGTHLDELYITTARKGLSTAQLSSYPLSGSLFRLQTEIVGMPTFEYGV